MRPSAKRKKGVLLKASISTKKRPSLATNSKGSLAREMESSNSVKKIGRFLIQKMMRTSWQKVMKNMGMSDNFTEDIQLSRTTGSNDSSVLKKGFSNKRLRRKMGMRFSYTR